MITTSKTGRLAWIGAPLLIAALGWSYWTTIVELWQIWMRSDEYSSGLLVPFIAAAIVWSRRHQIRQGRISPSIWGILLFLAAQALRTLGLFFMYHSVERLSLVVSIAAFPLLLFGARIFRKLATTLLFLCLMLPLPKSLEASITLPLQTYATSSAVFSLETIGYEVTREGNIIHLGETDVAVAEACNGLRMVTAFLIIMGLVVLIANRHWCEKFILLLSTLPVALACNTLRLAITAVAFTRLHGDYWEKIFHDFGGYAMMPLAIAAIVLELWILKSITTVPTNPTAQQVLETHPVGST